MYFRLYLFLLLPQCLGPCLIQKMDSQYLLAEFFQLCNIFTETFTCPRYPRNIRIEFGSKMSFSKSKNYMINITGKRSKKLINDFCFSIILVIGNSTVVFHISLFWQQVTPWWGNNQHLTMVFKVKFSVRIYEKSCKLHFTFSINVCCC